MYEGNLESLATKLHSRYNNVNPTKLELTLYNINGWSGLINKCEAINVVGFWH